MLHPFLRLSNVTKRFGGVTALDGVDWDVRRGEIHCLVGENGSGKSTLIKIVAGVHSPDAGSLIEIDGATHPRLDPATAKALGIRVIYQDLSLFPNLSVAENIAIDHEIGPLWRPVPKQTMRRTAQAMLDRLGFALPLDAPVSSLSIAERQVAAICRGLVGEGRLLFMDEPTASLTRHEVDSLLSIVRRLSSEGVAIVFVSHRLDEVTEVAERVTVLRDGRKVGTFPATEATDRKLAEWMTGLQIESAHAPRDRSAEPPVLEVANLTRRGEYEDVSFALRRGEILGLIGRLGAGRTELALSLFGMTRPDSGEIRLNGVPIRLSANRDAIRAGIAYAPEDRLSLGLNMRQSVESNLTLSVLNRLASRSGWIAPAIRRREAASWIDRLKIKIPALDAPVQQLSGGNQQRVVLARCLATEPKVLILDSPTVGVDIGAKQDVYDLARKSAERGVAVLLISDEAAEVFHVCDRALHMREGRIVGERVPGRVSEAELKAEIHA